MFQTEEIISVFFRNQPSKVNVGQLDVFLNFADMSYVILIATSLKVLK